MTWTSFIASDALAQLQSNWDWNIANKGTAREADHIPVVRLYHIALGWEWFVSEASASGEAFGLVRGYENELGYIDLLELFDVDPPVIVDQSFIGDRPVSQYR